MLSSWFRGTFLRVLRFIKIKYGEANFWAEAIVKKVWIFWFPLLYFSFKGFLDPNSLSFIRFQFILQDAGVIFPGSWNFYKLNWWNLISGVKAILQKVWFIWSTFLYFKFKSFVDPNSFSFVRFQSILHDSGVLFLESCNF